MAFQALGRAIRMAALALAAAACLAPVEASAQTAPPGALAPQGQTVPQGSIVVVRRVETILVEGNRRLDDRTIKSYMVVSEGRAATAEEINLSLRRLLDTGLFEDVTISPLGDGLLVQVREAPFINVIAFEGNDGLDDETLAAAIRSTPRSAFSGSMAERDAQTILELYRRSGRFAATVEPVIIERDNNRVDLVFEIFEGEVTGIRTIDFVGNKAFSDRRLRQVIETNESGVLGWLFGGDTYDPDRLELDKELLRRFYLDRGYADFRVLSATAELTSDRQDFLITFNVEEGQVYTFGDLNIDMQLPDIDPEPLYSVFVMDPGQDYRASDVDRSIDNLIFEVGQAGYAFVDVRPRADRDREGKIINLTLEVAEGPRVYIERIDIEGNTRTVDRVLRRQFIVAEGDAYNVREIEAARSRLRALGYFSRVEVATERGSADDRAVVRVSVEEQLTGSLSLGVGYSSDAGPVGEISITERNFLGRGQTVATQFNIQGDQQAVTFRFAEPALLDRDLEFGFDVGYIATDRSSESSFEETTIRFRPYTEFPIADDQRLRVRYRLSSDEIRDVDDFASPAIFEDEGTELTSAIGLTWTLDQRNDIIEPTRGYLLRVDQDLAGIGDNAYSRTTARAKAWRGFFEDEVVASLEIEGGAILSLNDNVRITERFFLGGDDFRGFERDGIGPRDVSTFGIKDGDLVGPGETPDFTKRRDDALGGNYFAVARADVSFPLGLPDELGVYGGLFADVGTLWNLDKTNFTDNDGSSINIDDGADLRASVGFSLFVDSAFGPLRFNWAYPIEYEEDIDQRQFFRFTVGSRF